MVAIIEENRSIVYKSLANNVSYILLGVISLIFFAYVFRLPLPLGPVPQHIVLCCLGYQVFMAIGFLSLQPGNGWTASLKLLNQRRVHWVLQLVGVGLALAGSIIMSMANSVNFNTIHGQTGLAALIFAGASCINGLTSNYAKDLSRILPPSLSKITHILFGIVAFVLANVSLCYGYDTNAFRRWAGEEVTVAIMAVTGVFTVLVIAPSCLTCWRKTCSMFKNS